MTHKISGGAGKDTIKGKKKGDTDEDRIVVFETINAGDDDDYVEGSDLVG